MHSNIKERFNNLLPKYAILPIIAALLINNCIYIGAAQLRNHLSFYSLAISLDEKDSTVDTICHILCTGICPVGIELHINWQRQQKTVLSVCTWRYSFQSYLSILLYIVSNHINPAGNYRNRYIQSACSLYLLCRCSRQPISVYSLFRELVLHTCRLQNEFQNRKREPTIIEWQRFLCHWGYLHQHYL